MIFSIAALLLSPLYALEFTLLGPCDKEPLHNQQINYQEGESVGSLTVRTLTSANIPFKGTERGINTINNFPTGNDAIEVISDSELRAYGFCYSVNDIAPEVYPDQVILKRNDHVLWWPGFSTYKNGKWITQCIPAYTVSPKFLCNK